MNISTNLIFLIVVLFVQSCSNKKENSVYLIKKAYSESGKGNLKSSLKLLDQAIELDPNCILAYMNRSLDKFDLGDTLGAISDCEEVIKINNKIVEAHFKIGFYYAMLNKHEKAINSFFDAEYAALRIPKAKFIMKTDGYFDAEFEYFVPIYEIYYHRANSYFKSEDYDLAIKDFEYCIKTNQYIGSCFDQIARCYLKMNNTEMACEFLEKALENGNIHSQKLIDENCK